MRVNSPPPALANRTLTPRPSLGDVALNTGGVGADLLHRRVELGLAAAGDEDVRAFFHEPLRDGQADPARPAGDDGDLSVQSRHRETFFVAASVG